MKEVRFSVYEVSMLKRYLNEFLQLKDEFNKKRKKKNAGFSTIEYDKEAIKRIIERLDGKDYTEERMGQSRNYSRDMYIGEGEEE